MRPGTSLIELRPPSWYDKDAQDILLNQRHIMNMYWKALWYTNTTFYHWHGLKRQHVTDGHGRDSSVRLSWQSLHCALETIARLDGDRAAYEREYRLGPKDLCREDGAREPQGGPREAWGAKHRAKAGEAAQKHAGSRHENGAPSSLHRRRQPGSLTPSESEEHLAIGAER